MFVMMNWNFELHGFVWSDEGWILVIQDVMLVLASGLVLFGFAWVYFYWARVQIYLIRNTDHE